MAQITEIHQLLKLLEFKETPDYDEYRKWMENAASFLGSLPTAQLVDFAENATSLANMARKEYRNREVGK